MGLVRTKEWRKYLDLFAVDTNSIRLNGPWVAFKRDLDPFLEIKVLNLRTGLKKESCEVGAPYRSHPKPRVANIVLKDNGSVAWVGKAYGVFRPPPKIHFTRLVVACDSRGQRVPTTALGSTLNPSRSTDRG